MDMNLTSVESAGKNSGVDVTSTSKPLVNDDQSLNLQSDGAAGSSSTSNENLTGSDPSGVNKVLKMKKAMDKTVEHCLSMLSYSSLKKHFIPSNGNRAMEKMLRSFQKEMVEKIRANIYDEIKLMIEEENIVQILNDFDSFLGSVSTSKVHWRPTGDPEKDVAAHLIDPLTTVLAKLDSTIAEEEGENDRLIRAVLDRRRLIENLRSKVLENQKVLVQNAIELEEWVEKTEATGY